MKSKDQQLLEEAYLSIYLKEAAPTTITFGQLKQAILDQSNKKLAGRLATTAAGFIPGVGTVSAAVDAAGAIAKRFLDPKGPAMTTFKKFMSVADSVRGGGILDKIDVDDNVSKMLADNVEDEFAKYMVGVLNKYPDEQPIPPDWNMTKELTRYLAQVYKGRTISVPQQNKAASPAAPAPAAPAPAAPTAR